jgi:hypothetical protein
MLGPSGPCACGSKGCERCVLLGSRLSGEILFFLQEVAWAFATGGDCGRTVPPGWNLFAQVPGGSLRSGVPAMPPLITYLFANVLGPTGRALLRAAPTPQDLVIWTPETLTNLLEKASRKRVGAALADRIRASAITITEGPKAKTDSVSQSFSKLAEDAELRRRGRSSAIPAPRTSRSSLAATRHRQPVPRPRRSPHGPGSTSTKTPASSLPRNSTQPNSRRKRSHKFLNPLPAVPATRRRFRSGMSGRRRARVAGSGTGRKCAACHRIRCTRHAVPGASGEDSLLRCRR